MAKRKQNQPVRAQARAANAGRRRKRRRRNYTLHYCLLLFFLCATALLLSFTVFFKIQDVTVVGVDRYAPNDVLEASGVVVGENLLRIRKKEIQTNLLEQFPYMETVTVRRKLSGVVEISVTQARPVAAILQGEEVILISMEGKILERGQLIVPEDVMLVQGINVHALEPADFLGEHRSDAFSSADTEKDGQAAQQKQLADETAEKLRMLQALLKAMQESAFERLTNVDLNDRHNMVIKYENRVILHMGSEADLVDKLKLCKKILDEQIAPDAEGILTPELERRRVYFRQMGLDQIEQQYEVPVDPARSSKQVME